MPHSRLLALRLLHGWQPPHNTPRSDGRCRAAARSVVRSTAGAFSLRDDLVSALPWRAGERASHRRGGRTPPRARCMGAHAEAAPRAVAPLRQPAAAAPGHGRQRGYWCCAPFALRRRRSSKSYSMTRQQLVQLWQDTLQLVQGGSGPRPAAAPAGDADAMTDASTPAA